MTKVKTAGWISISSMYSKNHQRACWWLIGLNKVSRSAWFYLTRLSVEAVDGQLFLCEPSARRPLFCPRVAAACQRLCRASVRAPLRALHRLRAFLWGIRWRHGCKSFITPNKLVRQSADKRTMWVKHARVKHPLWNVLRLHRNGASWISYIDRRWRD